MQVVLQIAAYLIGLSLEVRVMAVMLRGPWKRYPFVFAYVLGDFLTTILEIRPSLQYTATAQAKKSFAFLYWWDEQVMQLLVFLLVISLLYRAAAHLKARNTLLAGVICGSLLFAGITFLIYFNPTPSGPMGKWNWMTPWLRNLNFSAAILDLGLWALLIGARRKDYTLLLLSGGLGIQFTGGAIGQALRHMTHSSVQVTAYFITLSSLACLYIFCQAFHMRQQESPGASDLKLREPQRP